MKDAEEFLSEIYFYELETRDKIFNRLQLNFAIYTTVIAILAYMARMIDYDSNCTILTFFYVGLVFGISLISISIYYSCISLSLSDLKYMLFPRATDIIDYRSKLDIRWKEIEKYNQEYGCNYETPDTKTTINEFTTDIIAKCIDHNASINEYRRQGIRKSIWYMILASIPIIFSSALFVIRDLDTSSPRKNHLIEDRNLAVELKKLDVSIEKFITTNNGKDKTTMSEDQNSTKNQSKNTPPPPPPIQKPEPQYSTEDFKDPMPDKMKILNEKKQH